MFSTRLKKLLEKIILSLVFCITIPTLCVMLSPFYLFRALLKLVAKHFHSDWEIMNVRDTINHENVYPVSNPDDDMHHQEGVGGAVGEGGGGENENGLNEYERQPLTNIMILGIVAEGDPNLEKIRNFFRDYVLQFKNYKGELLYRKFFYYYESWFGYAFWKQTKDFRIEHHIRYLEEFNGKSCTTQEELEVFLGDYNTKPFPWKTPNWELLIVKNFLPRESQNSNSNPTYQQFDLDQNQSQDKKFVLIFRWQRGLADGHSIFKIIVNVFGGEANTILSHIHAPEQTLWANLKFYLGSLIMLGYNTIKLLLVNCDQNIWRISDEQLTGTCQMVTTNRLSYNVARTISKKRGVSVTSVLFTAVAGALRQYFIESGKERRIPKSMRVRVAVPCGASSHTFSRLTNTWSYETIKLPVGISDPSVRLHKVDQEIETVKKSLVPGFLWLLGSFYGALPHWLRQLSVHDKKTTLNSWYFAGPKEQLLLFGEYPGVSIISFLPRLNTDSAIGLTIFSYNGTICFTLCIDKALFSDRESAAKLAHLIEKNFFALQDLQESAIKVKH